MRPSNLRMPMPSIPEGNEEDVGMNCRGNEARSFDSIASFDADIDSSPRTSRALSSYHWPGKTSNQRINSHGWTNDPRSRWESMFKTTKQSLTMDFHDQRSALSFFVDANEQPQNNARAEYLLNDSSKVSMEPNKRYTDATLYKSMDSKLSFPLEKSCGLIEDEPPSEKVFRSSLEDRKPQRKASDETINIETAHDNQTSNSRSTRGDPTAFRSSIEARKPRRRLSNDFSTGPVTCDSQPTLGAFRSSIEAKKPCRRSSTTKEDVLSYEEMSRQLVADFDEDLTGRKMEVRQAFRLNQMEHSSIMQRLQELNAEFSLELDS